MKRKVALLALPLVLAALMLGVKWHAEHPTPTKQDLELRALLSQQYLTEVGYTLGNGISNFESRSEVLSKQDVKQLNDCLFILPSQNINTAKSSGVGINIYINYRKSSGVKKIDKFIMISLDGYRAKFGNFYSENTLNRLHPLTLKRWIELLLSNSRIGPELRRIIKSHSQI